MNKNLLLNRFFRNGRLIDYIRLAGCVIVFSCFLTLHVSAASETGKHAAPLLVGQQDLIVIKGKTGREISKYSKTPADQDVIFLPESKFKVTNYYQADQIALAQENIRNITFKIREKDIQRATEGHCIIVELQEI